MYKKISVAIVLVMVAFAGTVFAADAAAPASIKIGFVDINRVVDEHPTNIAWNKEYEKKKTQREDDVKNQIQNKFGVADLSEVKDPQLMDSIQKFYLMENDKFRQEMLPEHNKVLKSIEDDIITFSAILADQKGFTFVLDRAAIIYGGEDITDDILALSKNKGAQK